MPARSTVPQTLARRADFLRIAGAGTKCATAGLVVQACRRRIPAASAAAEPAAPAVSEQAGASMPSAVPIAAGVPIPAGAPIRVGYTASKKVGGSVQRNRAKRRMRALAREILAAEAAAGHDYVLIARSETVVRAYPDLKRDLRHALRRLGLLRAPGAPAAA